MVEIALRQIGLEDKEVNKPCAAYYEMLVKWELVEDLRKGTGAMRGERAQRWLPKEEAESEESYAERLGRTFLFPGYADATGKLAAKPFQKPTQLTGKELLPPILQLIESDADNAKSSITKFGGELFTDALHYGLSHYYVDLPRRDAPTTEATVKNDGVHPYYVHVKAKQVICWPSETSASTGREVLKQVRIRETRNERNGSWGSRSVNYVRVWNEHSWELWREKDGEAGTFVLMETDVNPIGVVPLVTYYTNQTGFMTAEPAMYGLAELSLQHWQESSDLRNSQHYACIPILHHTGVEKEKIGQKFVVASKRIVRTTKKPGETSLAWVESSGAASAQVAESIDKIEARMQKLGMAPLIEKSAPRTATEAGAEREDNMTTLHKWVALLNDSLYDGFRFAIKHLAQKQELPDRFTVKVFDEWQIAIGDDAGITTARDLYREGLIDEEEALNQINRRGYFGEGFDIKRLLSRLQERAGAPESTPEEKAELARIRKELAGQSEAA